MQLHCGNGFRSKIQGLGLYAARDLERHTMVIEYIGEVIRTELSELREKLYEARVSHIQIGQCGAPCCYIHFKFVNWCIGM